MCAHLWWMRFLWQSFVPLCVARIHKRCTVRGACIHLCECAEPSAHLSHCECYFNIFVLCVSMCANSFWYVVFWQWNAVHMTWMCSHSLSHARSQLLNISSEFRYEDHTHGYEIHHHRQEINWGCVAVLIILHKLDWKARPIINCSVKSAHTHT